MPLPDHDFDVTAMERTAYLLTAWKLGRYYRTYPAYVEAGVRAALRDPAAQFVRGERTLVARGTEQDDSAAQVVEDGRYLSARSPGDADLLARKFRELLEARPGVSDQGAAKAQLA